MYLTIAVTFRVYCLPRPFIKRLLYEDVLAGMCVCVVGGGGGGGVGKGGGKKSFLRGGSAARSNPLPFYEPFLTD